MTNPVLNPNAPSLPALASLLLGSEVHKDIGGERFLTKSDALVIKSIREATREVDFIASTAVVDSHDEIIDQASWQLGDYLANPVVLYGHASRELPIGQCTMVGVRNGQLECTIKFASAEANPFAEQVWRLVQERVLRAVSVGFRPTDARYEVRGGEEVFVWYGCILKEISVVPVPANPEALAKMKAAVRAAQTTPDAPATPAERNHETTGAPAGQPQESMMDLAALQKSVDESKAKLAEANVKQVEAEQRAEKAEAKLTVAEKALGEAESKLAALSDEAKIRETEHSKACIDRDAATARAVDAEAKLIALEVESLVGKKIAPTEREDFIALRKSNEALFKSMVEKRAEMKLDTRVTEPDEKANGKPAGSEIAIRPTGSAFNAL